MQGQEASKGLDKSYFDTPGPKKSQAPFLIFNNIKLSPVNIKNLQVTYNLLQAKTTLVACQGSKKPDKIC